MVQELSQAEPSPAAKQGAGDPTVCPDFHEAVELIGKRWTGAIVWALAPGRLYFSEFAPAVPGISDRLLSRRLRELETSGLVARSVHAGTPPRVSYELTPMGRELEPVILELSAWAKRWNAK